jgi:hypothetical protein
MVSFAFHLVEYYFQTADTFREYSGIGKWFVHSVRGHIPRGVHTGNRRGNDRIKPLEFAYIDHPCRGYFIPRRGKDAAFYSLIECRFTDTGKPGRFKEGNFQRGLEQNTLIYTI